MCCVSQVKLYVTQEAANTLSGVTVGNAAVTYSKGADPQPFILINTNIGRGTLNNVAVTLSFSQLEGGAQGICQENMGSYSVCSYILNCSSASDGSYQCCAHGDVAVAELL